MTAPRIQRCPICGKPEVPAEKPFCSRGCRDRDLLRWLAEGYRIPGPAADPDMLDDGSGGGVDKPGDPD